MRGINNYFMRHCQAAVNSLGQLSRSPLASLMTCFVIGITLALPTALFVTIKNFSAISGNLQQTMQITLYLKPTAKEADALKIQENLNANPDVHSVKLISPAEALKELQQEAGFNEAIAELPNNPLPWTLVVQPNHLMDLDNLANRFQKIPMVDSVQIDRVWAKRIAALMSLTQKIVYVLSLFLSLAVFLIINNAIRSATQQNQKEIEIIKLIGGTHTFIRRPFLYAGMVYGLLGGIIAWQLVDLLLLILRNQISHLTELYHSQFQLFHIGLNNTLILLVSSMGLGFAASWFAVTRHLKSANK